MYYIGIDGGGTKTLAYLANESKEIIAKSQVGATNHHTVGIDKTENEIKKLLMNFEVEEKVPLDDIHCICMGGAGIDSNKDNLLIEKIFRGIGFKKSLLLYNDGITALVGANGGKKGGILISGTGSIALGIDDIGKIQRVGGWGHIVDDGGSGYHIGMLGLKKILESYDGRGKSTLIWNKVSSKLDLSHEQELISYIYSHDTTKSDISALAICVIELIGKDRIADEIIDTAVNELVKLVLALVEKIGTKDISLGLSGSVLLKSVEIRELLSEKLKNHPYISIHLPYKDGAEGALRLAIDGGGI